jgi:hypothetical protein
MGTYLYPQRDSILDILIGKHWFVTTVEMAIVHVHGVDKIDPFISLDGKNNWSERLPGFPPVFALVLGLFHREEIGACG